MLSSLDLQTSSAVCRLIGLLEVKGGPFRDLEWGSVVPDLYKYVAFSYKFPSSPSLPLSCYRNAGCVTPPEFQKEPCRKGHCLSIHMRTGKGDPEEVTCFCAIACRKAGVIYGPGHSPPCQL